jgi:hypothetical protein
MATGGMDSATNPPGPTGSKTQGRNKPEEQISGIVYYSH